MDRLSAFALMLAAGAAFIVFLLVGGAATTVAGHNICATATGIPGTSDITKPETIDVAARALKVAKEHNASQRVMLATIMTIDVESKFDPTLTERQSDRDSSGAMQQRRHWVPRNMRPSEWSEDNLGSLGRVPSDPRVNLEWTVANFLDPKVEGIRGALYWDEQLPESATPGELAQATQISAFPDRYDEVRDRAELLMMQALMLIDEDDIVSAAELCQEMMPQPNIIDGATCPVGEPHHFTNTWGWARSEGRTHKGVDIFADTGIPIYAYQGGTIRLSYNRLGGISAHIVNDWGQFYYAHLSGYAPGIESGMEVETGQLIGYNGNTGNARFTPPHLHWEVRPGPPDARGRYTPVDPTPYASAVCSGG